MFGYPCILKIELYNFLIISMLFSSDEVVKDGIGRCHTLWLFCARLLSHSPACSPVFSILNEPRLSSHSFSKLLLHGAVFWVLSISSLFHKMGSQGWRQQFQLKPCKSPITPLYPTEKQLKDISQEAPGSHRQGLWSCNHLWYLPAKNCPFPSWTL